MSRWGTYRKLYDSPAPAFERLPFAARCLAAELLRRCDRMGRIVPVSSHGGTVDDATISDLAFHVRAHPGEEGFLSGAVSALLRDGYLVTDDGWLRIRNFAEAQRSESADRMVRKRLRAVTSRDVSDVSDVTSVTSVTQERGERGESPLVSSRFVSSPEADLSEKQDPPRAREAAEEHKSRPIPKHCERFERSFDEQPYRIDGWAGPDDEHREICKRAGLDLGDEERDYRDHCKSKSFVSANHGAEFSRWLRRSAKWKRRDAERNGKPPGVEQAELNAADHRAIEKAKRGFEAGERRRKAAGNE